MAKRITKLLIMILVFTLLSSVAIAQIGFDEPRDITTKEERVANFINAVKNGDTTAFRLITNDILAGKDVGDENAPTIDAFSEINENTVPIDITRDLEYFALELSQYTMKTPNVIDTVRVLAELNNVSFVEYMCDGDISETSETRAKVIRATLQGLFNLDPRVRLTAIEWLRRLRPDAIMFRDVERAVEYETVASSYEKYRPKNIDIPSIDEPGAYGTNFDSLEYEYEVDEEAIYYPFDEYDEETGDMVHPDEKVNKYDENNNIITLTEERPNATQLDARKWGNGNPFDPEERRLELYHYISVMMDAGALRRFRNTPDGYLLGYQYRLGASYKNNYSEYKNLAQFLSIEEARESVQASDDPNDEDGLQVVHDGNILPDSVVEELIKTMVPIGHGDKYFYRNIKGRIVLGNSWAELIKLREFIVRAIWYDKIRNLELNSLVIISKDSFKTLYLSIDGESAEDIPFLSTGIRYEDPRRNTDTGGEYTVPVKTDPEEQPRAPMLDQRHIPVLIQGLLKNPVYSTKWVIARALKDIFMMDETTHENKARINWALRQAKYDALAKDVIKGAVLHEELITVGKIDFTQNENYNVVKMDDDDRYPLPNTSGTYAGGVYIPRKRTIEEEDEGPRGITGFAIPNDEIIARRYTELVYKDDFNWYRDSIRGTADPEKALQDNQLSFVDRVLDSFSFYRFVVDENNRVIPAEAIRERVEGTLGQTDYTAPVVTYYSNRDVYLAAKRYYYQNVVNVGRAARGNEPVPYFNVEHYNRVCDFINAVYNGDNEVMATATWDIVESAQLLTMYRLFLMMESDMSSPDSDEDYVFEATKLLFERDSRIVFFDAFLESEYAEIEEFQTITKVDELTDTYDKVIGKYSIGGEEYKYFDELDKELFKDIAQKVDQWASQNYQANLKKNYSPQQKTNFINAALPGLYNKDPRVRLTAIHWLRRLGPAEEMFEEVAKARGILRQEDIVDTDIMTGQGNNLVPPEEEYELDETDPFNQPLREDRPDTGLDRFEFFDTNIYHRNNYPDVVSGDRYAELRINSLFDSLGAQKSNLTQANYETEMVTTVSEYRSDLGATGRASAVEMIRNRYFHSIIYIVSQDFQKFNYYRLNIREEGDPGDVISLDDMKPADPTGELEYPEFSYMNETGQQVLEGIADYPDSIPQQEQDLLQIISVANPLYTEDRYEYNFKSWGMYQFKSPSEELEKLYRFILRKRIVNRIKTQNIADEFVGMTRFEFSILSLPLDYEYVLRIPMSSFFGLDPNYGADPDFGGVDLRNGDYNPDKAFLLPKGELLDVSNEDGIQDAYNKYPIFRESQIMYIQQGVDNPNFMVRKGTAEFLIRFYNFYANISDETKRDIRDAMFYYKKDDIVIEEVVLAIEAEQPQGRAVIKAGSRLGNDLNPGGVRQYRQLLPAELRRDVRRTINREVQSFEREIANILGVRRKTAVGATDTLGYFSGEGTYTPVKPGDEADVKGEEEEDASPDNDDNDDDDDDDDDD